MPCTQAKIIRLRKPMELFGGWDDQQLKASFEVGIRSCWQQMQHGGLQAAPILMRDID